LSRCVAVHSSELQCVEFSHRQLRGVVQCVAACCVVLQCVAVCCSVLQCVAVPYSVSQCVEFRHRQLRGVSRCVAECCSVLQRVATCCSVLRRAAVCCSALNIGIINYVVCCSVSQCVPVWSVMSRAVVVILPHTQGTDRESCHAAKVNMSRNEL